MRRRLAFVYGVACYGVPVNLSSHRWFNVDLIWAVALIATGILTVAV
jgi:hypothetical protein